MRRLAALVLLALMCFALAGCGGRGDVSLVRLDRGSSELFAAEDVRAAMDAAMDAFRRECGGQTLRALRYDEGYSAAWLTAHGPEPDGNTLVLLASWTDADGNNYDGVPWALERRGGRWNILDWSF